MRTAKAENTRFVVRFETIGCKLNQMESEAAARSFADCGFDCRMGAFNSASPVDTGTVLCVVNTCTVTAKAEQKCRRLIRLLLQKCPAAAVLVTGCYAQLEAKELSAISDRVAVLLGRDKDMLAVLPRFLRETMPCENGAALAEHLRHLCTFSSNQNSVKPAVFTLATDTFLRHSRPSLKIQDGCNCRCTYCRICLARGQSVSLDPNEILERVLQLEKSGHREVVLTGVNLSQYSAPQTLAAAADGKNSVSFAKKHASGKKEVFGIARLLAFLLEHTETLSFRLSSLHPQSITDELCEVLKKDRVRPHFHLSVQSGSDRILSAMGRSYTVHDVTNALRRLRSAKKNPFIACDIIAGFPGETDEDFSATFELCKNGAFSWVHAFSFSPRPGTKAFEMKNTVSPETAKKRVRLLTDLAAAQKRAYIESCIGTKVKAIVEKYRKGDVRAVTENFLHVRIIEQKQGVLRDHSAAGGVNIAAAGGSEVTVCIQAVCEKGLCGEEYEADAVFCR